MKLFFTLSVFCIINCTIPAAFAQTLPPGFSISTIGTGWTQPVGAAFNKAGTKLFVWEKAGKLYVCNWDLATQTYIKQAIPVLDISPEVGDWRDHGMLGFTIDPNFDANGLIYVLYVVDRHYLIYFGTPSYSATTNDYLSATIGRVTRYKTITSSGNLVADPNSRFILLGETKSTGIPILHESHGIGSLAFAADGTLLISAGDAASYNTTDAGNLAETYYAQALTDGIIRANENVGAFKAQMVNSMDGKLLRIDPVTGNGISSNPFYSNSSPRSAKSRMWAMGFRNPFRFCVRPNTGSTNPATGDIGEIYLGDVGWNTYEELNIIRTAATNCGWPLFEGLTGLSSYQSVLTANKDEPNPLYGTGGCTNQYFNFQNLIKQATSDNITTVYNPCNAATAISSGNNNRFFHRVPVLDWKHGIDSARVKKFNGNILGVAQIGTSISGVNGIPFRGNAAVGGCWYTGNMFPASFRNTYFQADYGGTWLKNFTIQYVDQVQTVHDFASGFIAIVCVAENPLDGSLVCVDLGTSTIKKIVYGGNQPPVVKMSSNKIYGPTPLAVNFTGSGSYDPEGSPLTYSWNFGDGSALNTLPNPAHTFTTTGNAPKKFVVSLTVKDNLNATSSDSMIISLNNTPPVVHITSPANNSLYQPGTDTSYLLRATVTDAEHTPGQLFYQWQTILRHNNHQHPEPVDTNKNTSAVISRIGCNGDTYFWLIKLKVTDAAGLSTTDSTILVPICGGPLPIILNSFLVNVYGNTNIATWVTSAEVNLDHFEIERSYDGINFELLGTVDALRLPGLGNYSFTDSHHTDGYVYYRLKMVDIGNIFHYSDVVKIYSGKVPTNTILVSPNPAKDECTISGVFSKAGKITVRIISMSGILVKTINENVAIGINKIKIDALRSISNGTYLIEVVGNNEIRRSKMIKAN